MPWLCELALTHSARRPLPNYGIVPGAPLRAQTEPGGLNARLRSLLRPGCRTRITLHGVGSRSEFDAEVANLRVWRTSKDLALFVRIRRLLTGACPTEVRQSQSRRPSVALALFVATSRPIPGTASPKNATDPIPTPWRTSDNVALFAPRSLPNCPERSTPTSPKGAKPHVWRSSMNLAHPDAGRPKSAGHPARSCRRVT